MRSQGGAEGGNSLPQDAKNYILTKNLAKFLYLFCPKSCLQWQLRAKSALPQKECPLQDKFLVRLWLF